jgi:acetyl-CoA carboxylase biotin carboxyl carrier protein
VIPSVPVANRAEIACRVTRTARRLGIRAVATDEDIVADLAANVWKIVVEPGARVDPGGTIAVLESMRLEIPVEAEEPGVVQRIAVAEGDAIEEGALIAVLRSTDG